MQADAEGHPTTVFHRETELQILSVEDRWRVEDEWWREEPIARSYYDVVLVDGRRLTLYHDQATNRWYEQRDG